MSSPDYIYIPPKSLLGEDAECKFDHLSQPPLS